MSGAPGRAKGADTLVALDPTRALYFSVVAEKSSITLAAQALGVNASTVSRKLDELEWSLGVRLIERDTRSLRLTEAGDSYLHYAVKAISTLELGRQSMERYAQEVRGRLRVLSPPAIGRRFIADLVVEFSMLYPDLQVSLKLDAKPFSLADSEFDVGLSIGMPVEDRAVISKLGDLSSGYVATPKFLRQHGKPQDIYALVKLPIAAAAYHHTLPETLIVSNAEGESAQTQTKLPTNDAEVVLRAVLSGQFCGLIMHWYCAEELLSGRLQKVMPELDQTSALYSVVPNRKGKPQKVQLFIDFLKTRLSADLRAVASELAELGEA